MKYLLFGLAVLMLGCGTDTEVAEEPDPDTKVFVVHDIDPTASGDRADSDPPRIVKSNVYPQNERVSFNSERLNREGIFFDFNEDLHQFVADLSLDGESLRWITSAIRTGDNTGFSVTLSPPVNGPFLERRKQYLINLVAGDKTGNLLELEIEFWTIP